MSKVDAQRAMREARYAQLQAQASAVRRAAPGHAGNTPTTPRVTPTTPPRAARVQVPPEQVAPDLCGHRNIGSKTCQRPAGHPEKNHRYRPA